MFRGSQWSAPRFQSRSMVRPKKYLGQHFLTDQNIAKKIVDTLEAPSGKVLEIGPGTGVLTQYLLKRPEFSLKLVELDQESVDHLNLNFLVANRIIHGDFLKLEMTDFFEGKFSIIGNFPYNISSQIFFKILEFRNQVEEIVCMLQKEVADRIASPHGNKTYGILSVFLQAYYNIRPVAKVSPGAFFPPPKVMSSVIRLSRNNITALDCDEQLFRKVVKQGFQNRRKTLRNSLKALNLPALSAGTPNSIVGQSIFDKRAEQLSVSDFIGLTKLIEEANERSSRV